MRPGNPYKTLWKPTGIRVHGKAHFKRSPLAKYLMKHSEMQRKAMGGWSRGSDFPLFSIGIQPGECAYHEWHQRSPRWIRKTLLPPGTGLCVL